MGLNGRNGNLILSEKDLKVDGIGVGSTFNEMYEKFGNPGMIIPVKDGLNDGVIAMYGYADIRIKERHMSLCLNIQTRYSQLKAMKIQSLM